MTDRTTVTESVAKKLCFAGEESGVGFVVSRKKHVDLSALFPGVTKGNA